MDNLKYRDNASKCGHIEVQYAGPEMMTAKKR